MRKCLWICLAAAAALWGEELPREDGYRGIWYFNQPTKDEYVYKYSGGFATYPQQQSPMAVYAPKVKKTFFCYGGTVEGRQELLHMVSYYDHRTGMVPRPARLVNKKTDDAHDNPVMTIDGEGYLWIFSNAHGTTRPSYIWKSDAPYSIAGFTRVLETNFSYGHSWYVPGQGFLFLHTRYQGNHRGLFTMTSTDGRSWSEPAELADFDMGHYQVTAQRGAKVASVFNMHPAPLGLNARTNLYYIETEDLGRSWRTADGKPIATPIHDAASPALVHDYRKEGKLVYLKNVEFDKAGRPVILYLTSKCWQPGPGCGPQEWQTARWTGREWEIRGVTTSDHNYDFGMLSIGWDGVWRLVAPTAPGPQPFGTGGDMVLWNSRDQGRTWKRIRQLTHGKERNATYAKVPAGADRAFFAIWADGDTRRPSESALYFTDREGSAVWRLPSRMTGEFARPERVK